MLSIIFNVGTYNLSGGVKHCVSLLHQKEIMMFDDRIVLRVDKQLKQIVERTAKINNRDIPDYIRLLLRQSANKKLS